MSMTLMPSNGRLMKFLLLSFIDCGFLRDPNDQERRLTIRCTLPCCGFGRLCARPMILWQLTLMDVAALFLPLPA